MLLLAPDAPTVAGIEPRYGVEAGGTPVTVTGANFTASPSMAVEVGGAACTSVTWVNDTTLTCVTPAGTNGWEDVSVSNAYGGDTLTGGYRYFPTGGDPFNGTDIPTGSMDTPETVALIASGQPSEAHVFFVSLGGGPLWTEYGWMGLDYPIYRMLPGTFNPSGYRIITLGFPSGFGPLDLYMHCLSYTELGAVVWAYGGNNPNGSGSVWFHLNN